jgi:hypothetical protein
MRRERIHGKAVKLLRKGKERGRFFVKKLRKKLLSWGHGSWNRHGLEEQKVFAELFSKSDRLLSF